MYCMYTNKECYEHVKYSRQQIAENYILDSEAYRENWHDVDFQLYLV